MATDTALQCACRFFFCDWVPHPKAKDGHPMLADEFLEAWMNGHLEPEQEPIVWEPFENYDPDWIVDHICSLAEDIEITADEIFEGTEDLNDNL